MSLKKKKYKKIADYLHENFIITNLYNDVSIKISMKKNKIECSYDGAFEDILGASFDLINGLIENYSSDFDYSFWKNILENFDLFKTSCLYKEFLDENLDGKINFKIDGHSQNIKSEYSSSVIGFILMIDCFIDSFCGNYNIDKKEYFEYLDSSHKYFIDHDCKKRMNVVKL